MAANKTTPSGALRALFGMLGFSVLAGILVTVMVTPAVAVTGMAATTSVDIFNNLPNYIELGQLAQRNRIFALKNDGSEVQIATVFSQNREEVSWDQTSGFLKQSAMSAEDRHFYEHGGVDVPSLARALVQNATSTDGIQSGGSTLTMQLVKNIFVMQAIEQNPAKDAASYKKQQQAVADAQATTVDRKLRDIRLAIALEKKYTKDQILQAYLNISGFGGTTYGVEAAAERYYSTNVTNVTLAQAASLVAIVQSPTKRGLDDASKYAANKERRDEILQRMLQDSKDGTAKFPITQAQYDEAMKTPVDASTVKLQNPPNGCLAAYQYATWACDYVTNLVPELAGLGDTPDARRDNWTRGGYDIHTSLNVDLNQVATQADQKFVSPTDDRAKLAAVTTSVEVGTGWVRTLAQNKDYSLDPNATGGQTALNFAVPQEYGGSGGAQPGSTFKAFSVINWLQSGHGLKEVVDFSKKTRNQADYPYTCSGGWTGPYTGKNAGGESGRGTILDATARSVNNAFFEMAKQMDSCQTKQIAEAFGVTKSDGTPLGAKGANGNYDWTGLSWVIGSGGDNVAPLTMAAAYAGIAGLGNFCKPIIVTDIKDSTGKSLGGQSPDCKQVADQGLMAGVAYDLNYAYKTYNSYDSSTAPMIGKTGTTDNAAQTWVIESSTKVATANWVGQYDSLPNKPPATYASITNLGLFNARHSIAKIVNAAVNKVYGGDQFPTPDPKYLNGGKQATVPTSIIGQDPNDAQSTLEALGFDVTIGSTIDSDQPAGTVASSDPAPGSPAPLGSSVTLYISNGSQVGVNMPDVVNGNPPQAQAVATLQAAGFTNIQIACQAVSGGTTPGNGNQGPGNNGNGNNGNQNQTQSSPLKGRVLNSNPSPGSRTQTNAPVTLTVAQDRC